MSRDPSPAPQRLRSTTAATTVPGFLSFDESWEAWLPKGAARDRAVWRRLAVAAPLVAIVAAAIFFALVIR